MQEVVLKIKRKSYGKSEPTVKDVVLWCNHIMQLEEGKVETSKDAIYLMVTIVSDYLNLDIQKILSSKIKTNDISKVYRNIQSSINNSLIESGYVINKDSGIQLFEDIYRGIMHIANDLLFEKGVLPDQFFKQTFKDLMEVVSFEAEDNDFMLTASKADETGF